MAMYLIILAGLLSVVYGVVTNAALMKADAGNARMQEIAGAIAEGAQAYLRRQYITIGAVGVVIFIGLGEAESGASLDFGHSQIAQFDLANRLGL